MKEKVAVIRGANANKFELQTYEHICNFEVDVYTSLKPLHNVKLINLNTKSIFMSSDLYASLPQPINRVFKIVFETLLGYKHLFLGRWQSRLRKYSIVHTADPDYYYSYQLAKNKQFKLISTVWENIPYRWASPHGLKERTKKTLDSIDGFIAVSERSRDILILAGVSENKIKVVHPGVDIDVFKPGKNNKKQKITIGYVGKLNKAKGVKDLLLAYYWLITTSGNKENIELLIIGNGPEYRFLTGLISELNIADSVRIIKYVDYSKMNSVYQEIDIFVLPSVGNYWWQEQIGMVLLEAMASGCSVIGANSGSIPEVVGGGGLVYTAGDWRDMCKSIERLTTNPELLNKMKERARIEAEKRFDSSKNSVLIENFYSEILER